MLIGYPSKEEGFTLIESLLYIGLFAVILTGTIASTYPIFSNTQNSTESVIREGEVAFVVRKINTALFSATDVSVPLSGDEVRVTLHGGEVAWFRDAGGAMEISRDSGSSWEELTASRVEMSNLTAVEVAPTGDAPRYVEYSFDADGETVGTIRKIFHF